MGEGAQFLPSPLPLICAIPGLFSIHGTQLPPCIQGCWPGRVTPQRSPTAPPCLAEKHIFPPASHRLKLLCVFSSHAHYCLPIPHVTDGKTEARQTSTVPPKDQVVRDRTGFQPWAGQVQCVESFPQQSAKGFPCWRGVGPPVSAPKSALPSRTRTSDNP